MFLTTFHQMPVIQKQQYRRIGRSEIQQGSWGEFQILNNR